MDFGWTEEQEAFREAVIGFARRDLSSDVVARDSSGTFDREAWRKCAEFGLQGLPIPKEFGGTEADARTTMLALEALGYGCRDNGLVFSLTAHMWAVQHPILAFGTEEQKDRYLPGLVDGSLIGGHGMSEPDSGSDAFALATTAALDGDHYRLQGSKTFVTNAPVADVFVVFATTNRSEGFLKLCAFLVDRDAPGLTVGPELHKMGLRTSPMSELFLDDCRVPVANLLGRKGGGAAVFNAAMERERSMILASVVGSMQRGLEAAIEHAKRREQFGTAIGKFQAVSHRIVEMKLRLETSRLLLYHLGWLLDTGKPAALDAALVKLHLSESFLASSLDTLQVHGGYGYMTDAQLERDVRDAVGGRLYSGTSDIQRNLAARLLGL